MKKIVIIFESHIDMPSIEAESKLIQMLSANGCEVLCLEYPEPDVNKLIITIESMLKFLLERLREALDCLINRHKLKDIEGKPVTAATLQNMPFLNLCELMRKFVSSQHYTEVARFILDIKPTMSKLKLIKAMKDKMQVIGVDLPLPPEQRSLPIHFAARERHMLDFIEKFARENKPSVSIIGKTHAPGIIQALGRKGLLSQAVFLDLQSTSTFVTDPEYFAFAARFSEYLHTVDIHPEHDITPQLPRICRLLDIPTPTEAADADVGAAVAPLAKLKLR